MAFTPLSRNPDCALPLGTFDVRGWDVRTMVDGDAVGKIDDVLLDENGTPRYLDIDVGLLKKHVLLPIGQAQVDEAEDVVWVPGMTKDQFQDIPAYSHDAYALTGDYEASLTKSYLGAYRGEHYYSRPEYRADGVALAGAAAAAAPADARLESLRDLRDFRVAEGDPDPRHWELIAGDAQRMGEIDDLIVDTAAMKVRYLDCSIDEQTLGLDHEDRHVLVPIGYARLNESEKQVIVDAISSRDVPQLPLYGGLPLTREYEDRLHTAFTEGIGTSQRFRQPRFSSERFYEPRQPNA